MREPFVERRRTPRVAVAGRARAEREVPITVRLSDISPRGVLLMSSQRLEAGEWGRVRIRLGAIAIDGDIEVRRVTSSPDGQGYRAGARFVSLDPTTAHAIQRFLAAATR